MLIIRKPTFWLTIAAVIIAVVLVIILADPGGDRHMQPADLISKVSDESIRQDIQEILQQGVVKTITTGLDREDRVQFILNYGDKEYRQGFYHIGSDPTDFINNNENSGYEYNQGILF